MKIRIKIQGLLIFLALAASIFLSEFLLSGCGSSPFAGFFETTGVGILLLGFLFRISARGQKAEMSPGGRSLMATGLYSITRNPMYLGTFLIGSGVILAVFKLWAFFLFLAIFSAIYIPQIRKEEAALFKLFGLQYSDYCRMAPRFFPAASVFFKRDIGDYLFFRRQWVKKEVSSLIWISVLVIAIKVWQAAKLPGDYWVWELTRVFLSAVFFTLIFTVLLYKKNEKQSIFYRR